MRMPAAASLMPTPDGMVTVLVLGAAVLTLVAAVRDGDALLYGVFGLLVAQVLGRLAANMYPTAQTAQTAQDACGAAAAVLVAVVPFASKKDDEDDASRKEKGERRQSASSPK